VGEASQTALGGLGALAWALAGLALLLLVALILAVRRLERELVVNRALRMQGVASETVSAGYARRA
jgi:hypothetical protein